MTEEEKREYQYVQETLDIIFGKQDNSIGEGCSLKEEFLKLKLNYQDILHEMVEIKKELQEIKQKLEYWFHLAYFNIHIKY